MCRPPGFLFENFMSTTTEFTIPGTIQQVVPNVFTTMAALSVSPHSSGNAAPAIDRVSGTIGIAGDIVTGAIYVHLPEAFARLIVNAMMGNPPEQSVGDSDLNDVVGELTNMIGGGFKSALCDAGRPCAMSTPSIIRGAYGIELPQDLQAETLLFQCGSHIFAVEVHIQFI